VPVTELRRQQDALNAEVIRITLPIVIRATNANAPTTTLAGLLFPRMTSWRSAASALAFATARAIAPDVPRFDPPPYLPGWLIDALTETRVGPARVAPAKVTARLVRHVEQAGRDTTLRAAIEAPSVTAWARVSAGAPCGFCLMLIGRGAVYATQRTAVFHAHDHDRCIATLVRKGQRDWTGAQEAADAAHTYASVTRGLRGADALRALNRHVDKINREAST
jgi:hypothetical protein